MSAEEHAAAPLERLRTFGTEPPTVFDDKIPNGTRPPYLLLRFSLLWLGPEARPDAVNLAGIVKAATCTVQVYAVGASAGAARILIDRATAAFQNWRPTIAGRTCTPMRQEDSFDTPPDERTGIAYHELGAVWAFTSHPA